MSMTIERPVEVKYTPGPVETSSGPKSKWKLRFTREHIPLTAILLLSAFLGLWNLSINEYSNSYYAAAVKSMLTSWHNFFFVSFDPNGIVTVDKPPVAFWIQAAFAKVLGFNTVSILLPEALAGVGGVFLLYLMVKKAWGKGAGLIAALILTVTPIFVAMNRHNNPDSILVFTLLVAAWAILRAADKGKLRWLMLSAVMVGVAFNVKMLEAFMVLPAFYAMYFLLAKTKWWKRIIHLALATIVLLAISLSWAVAVDLTPASERPYVDSSSKNSELDLILGYNGLGRITGNENGNGGNGGPSSIVRNADGSAIQATSGTTTTNNGSGNSSTSPTNTFGTQGGSPGGTPPGGDFGGGQPGSNGGGMNNNSSFGGNPGLTRLVIPSLAAEFNWFGPLALISLIFMGTGTLFSKTKDDERMRKLRGIVLWGGWLLTFAVVFSFSQGTFHNYYLTIMAPAIAALAGAGLVTMWKQYRKGGWAAWVLPVALAASAFYQAYILSGYTSWNTWLSPVLIVVGIAALVGLGLGRLFRQNILTNRLSQGITWATMAVLLVTPAALSVKLVFTAITGTFPSGTPTGTSGGFGGATTGSGNWLTFIQEHLSGQLIVLGAVLITGAVLVGLAFLFKPKRFLTQPVLTGLLLALLVVGSTGWWYSAAQTASAQTASTSARTMGNFGGNMGGNVNSELLAYLVANQNGYANIVAVSSSNSAASLYLESGQGVISLGGFSGSDNIFTSTSQLEELVSSGIVRYFLLGGMGGGQGSNSVVSSYVTSQCKLVDSSAYSSSSSATAMTTPGVITTGSGSATSNSTGTGASSSDTTRSAGGMGNQQQQLYVCGS